tara:strand:- start:236 stop:2671 length:2436 start_codon:yes stop_codon:yes gene_type:complete
MPRPLVEVRQSVLNPVVTVNEPSQKVCLVGLHTKFVDDSKIKTIDRISSVAAGSELHITAPLADHQVISVSESGTVINQDIDLGEDAYDIEGDLAVTFKNVYVSDLDITGYYNHNVANGQEVAFTPNRIILNTAGQLNDYADRLGDIKIALQPEAAHFNKLVPATGTVIDFVTGEITINGVVETNAYLKALVPGGSIWIGANQFAVIKIEAGALYLRGITDAGVAALAANSSPFAISTSSGANSQVPNASFNLNHAGVHITTISTVVIDASNSANSKVVEVEDAVPFAVNEADKADAQGAILYHIKDSVAPVSRTTDTADALSVALTSSGIDFTVAKDKFVATPAYTGASAKKIVMADLHTSYTVALSSYSAAVTEISTSDRVSTLGNASAQNPLSLAAELALRNSGNSKVSILALDLSPESGATQPKTLKAAFTQALNVLNRNDSVYAMVPLTQDLSIAKQYSNAADSLSLPAKGKFRICLGTSPGAPSVEYIIGSVSAPSTTGTYTHGTTTLTDTVNSFKRVGSTVIVGDSIILTQGTSVFTGDVSGVTGSALTITWDAGSAPTVDIADVDSYYITRSLAATTKIPRQIELLRADSTSIAGKRLFISFPGKCSVSSEDLTATLVNAPGYYVTAAFSGLLARFRAHRPKNFLGLLGVTSLEDFSRFTDEQLDEISDAGYLVFQQTEPTSAPFCIHQVNSFHGTQPGTQEFTELSVISNFDFVSRAFKNVLSPFAGTVNIVPSTLDIIRASLDSSIASLRSDRVATIGAPLISGTVDFVRKSSVDDGTVETQVTVSLPKVLNKITIEVVSS